MALFIGNFLIYDIENKRVLQKFLKTSLELNIPKFRKLVEDNLLGILEDFAKSPLHDNSDESGKFFFSKSDGKVKKPKIS